MDEGWTELFTDEELIGELRALSLITGKRVPELLRNAVRHEYAHYRNGDGEIRGRPATWSRPPAAERQAARNAGAPEPEPKEKPCVYLYDTTICGAPYAAIVADGMFIKTPREYVRLTEGEAEHE